MRRNVVGEEEAIKKDSTKRSFSRIGNKCMDYYVGIKGAGWLLKTCSGKEEDT